MSAIMKRQSKGVAWLLAMCLLFGMMFLTSAPEVKAATAKLSKKSVTLTVGKTTTVKVKNTKKKVKWSVNKKNYLTLTKKSSVSVRLKAKKAGSVKVYAKFGKSKLTLKVKIIKKIVVAPSATPTLLPTFAPTAAPAVVPTAAPTTAPTAVPTQTPKPNGNLTYSNDVSSQMCNAAYWISQATDPDKILATSAEIATQNQKYLTADDTYMHDLANMSETYNGDSLKTALGAQTTPAKTYYLDGEQLTDKEAYFQVMRDNINAAETTSEDKILYALCTSRAQMRAWPTSDVLGYSETDADDELLSSAMNVNEPFVIKMITGDGKYAYGMSTNCTGWVELSNLAICEKKADWLASWQGESEDFLVVTTNRITLESSNFETATADVKLFLGTQLKLVPKSEIPTSISERGTWNNYVIYVPTRDSEGKYVRKVALLSQHYNVSVGYLPFNQRNVLEVAFECLGDRYGWGGMLDAMDCSLYTRSIYRCFGMELPRNTTWQKAIDSKKYNLTGMTDSQKETLLASLPAGTLLYFSGHTMMYVGHVADKYYVISATGSLADSTEPTTVQSMYSVILNSLDVKRKNSTTWLNNIDTAVCPWSK